MLVLEKLESSTKNVWNNMKIKPHILYFLGLNSSLIPPKREILEKYGKVEAFQQDYMTNSNILGWLNNSFQIVDYDIVIGSSMGGLMGYYLSRKYNKPALLFHPALTITPVPQKRREIDQKKNAPSLIILGLQDEVL